MTQSGGAAVVNNQVELGLKAGTTGQAIYNPDGGEPTIKHPTEGRCP